MFDERLQIQEMFHIFRHISEFSNDLSIRYKFLSQQLINVENQTEFVSKLMSGSELSTLFIALASNQIDKAIYVFELGAI